MENNIQRYRKQLRISQTKLGRPLGWGQVRISAYENGIRIPSVDQARLLIRAFASYGLVLSLDDLFPPDLSPIVYGGGPVLNDSGHKRRVGDQLPPQAPGQESP